MAQAAGGVDRYIRMLLKYLDKEKFENILVCSQDFNREDYDGLVDSFEQIEMNRAIGVSDLNSIKEVRRLIKKYNPDIVYAHSSKAGAIARVADIGLKNHCVYNPHGWAFNMRCSDKKRAMYTAIEKMAAPFCEKIICISDAEKQSALEKKICREDKLQVIFNGVDIEAYESGEHGTVKRSSLGIPEDAYVVGMVGRISPQKAPDVFVKMAKLVKDEIPNAHFVIVGSGNQEAEIRKFVSIGMQIAEAEQFDKLRVSIQNAIVFVLVCAVKVFCSLFGGSDISKLLDLPTFYFMFAVIILECKENRLKGNFYKHLRSTSETMYFIHMYFVAFCALVLYKDDYNNFKSYLICAGGALAVSEIYSWMKNISNRSTTVSRLKHD